LNTQIEMPSSPARRLVHAAASDAAVRGDKVVRGDKLLRQNIFLCNAGACDDVIRRDKVQARSANQCVGVWVLLTPP
jgi:hypothetical protein